MSISRRRGFRVKIGLVGHERRGLVAVQIIVEGIALRPHYRVRYEDRDKAEEYQESGNDQGYDYDAVAFARAWLNNKQGAAYVVRRK